MRQKMGSQLPRRGSDRYWHGMIVRFLKLGSCVGVCRGLLMSLIVRHSERRIASDARHVCHNSPPDNFLLPGRHQL